MASVELRHLRYFVAVARHLSFTAAAESLGISQPPLSQQIRTLELEIGTDLFERTTRRVVLTRAGQDFLGRAEAILEKSGEAMDRARAIGNGTAGILNIGLTGSILAGPLGGIVHAFGQRHGDVDLRLHEMSPNRQIFALKSHQVDLIFLRSPPRETDFALERAWRERLCVVLPADHALAARPALRLAELAHETFVVMNPNESQFAHDIWNRCIGTGFTPRIAQQVIEATSLVSLVAAGLGIAIAPEFVGGFRHGRVVCRPLAESGATADVHALHPPDCGPIVEKFLALTRAHAEEFADRLRREG
jgi:DNA-binding transcriptional LysR family regulator